MLFRSAAMGFAICACHPCEWWRPACGGLPPNAPSPVPRLLPLPPVSLGKCMLRTHSSRPCAIRAGHPSWTGPWPSPRAPGRAPIGGAYAHHCFLTSTCAGVGAAVGIDSGLAAGPLQSATLGERRDEHRLLATSWTSSKLFRYSRSWMGRESQRSWSHLVVRGRSPRRRGLRSIA